MKYKEPIDEKKVKQLTKELDEKYGDMVLSPDNHGGLEEMEAIAKHNERAKLLRAEKREREWLEKPSTVEKWLAGIQNLFKRAKSKQSAKQKETTR